MCSTITTTPMNKTFAVRVRPDQQPFLNAALIDAGLPTFDEDDQIFIVVTDKRSIVTLAVYENGKFYGRIIMDCQKPKPAVVRYPVWEEEDVEVEATLLVWWKFNMLTHLIDAKGPFPESCVKFDALVYDEPLYPGADLYPWDNKIVTNPVGGIMVLINTEDPADRYYLTPFDPRV